MLRDEIQQLAAKSNGRFKVYHTLNNAPQNWTGGKGFITQEMILQNMHKGGVSSGSKVLLCGPPPMMTAMK